MPELDHAFEKADTLVKRIAQLITEREDAENATSTNESETPLPPGEDLLDPLILSQSLQKLDAVDNESAYKRLRKKIFSNSPTLQIIQERIRYMPAAVIGIVLISAALLYFLKSPHFSKASIINTLPDNQPKRTSNKMLVVPISADEIIISPGVEYEMIVDADKGKLRFVKKKDPIN